MAGCAGWRCRGAVGADGHGRRPCWSRQAPTIAAVDRAGRGRLQRRTTLDEAMPTTAAAELVEVSADDCGSDCAACSVMSTRALTTTVVDGLAT
eukprot:9668480-Heterocapsa_arctica.AAC.1